MALKQIELVARGSEIKTITPRLKDRRRVQMESEYIKSRIPYTCLVFLKTADGIKDEACKIIAIDEESVKIATADGTRAYMRGDVIKIAPYQTAFTIEDDSRGASL